jgi:CRISPR/Cas system-associated exonuclease Cas4 (RecB family)
LIVDFKTGAKHEHIRTDLQMKLYCLAYYQQASTRADEAGLYFIERGEFDSARVSDEWLDNGRAELSSAIARIRKREFGPTPGEPCGRCEYRAICCYRK